MLVTHKVIFFVSFTDVRAWDRDIIIIVISPSHLPYGFPFIIILMFHIQGSKLSINAFSVSLYDLRKIQMPCLILLKMQALREKYKGKTNFKIEAFFFC